MYMILTFFTISYLYINLKIAKTDFKINKKTGLYLAINVILGYLTQYFFIIYAILVSIIMIILFITNKKYKEMLKYIGILGISAIIGMVIFPFSIKHLLFSERGINSFEETNYIRKIFEYFKLILRYFGSNFEIVLALFAIALLAIVIKRKKERGLMAIIIAPAILYPIIIAKLTEFIELRYVMNILPIIAIMIIMAISSIFENTKYNMIIASVALIVLIGYGFITEKPLYLYEDYKRYVEIAEKYKEDDFVYIGYSFFNHMQSMPEFMTYNKSLIIFNDQIDRLKGDEELKDKNEFILSVNISMEPEKTVNEVIEKSGYSGYELLYEGAEEVEQVIYRIYK